MMEAAYAKPGDGGSALDELGEGAVEVVATSDQYIALEYDFMKHVTSLSLIAIGGALTFAGTIFAAAPNQSRLWIAVAVLIVAGTSAFSGQQALLKRLRTGKPVGRSVSLYREFAILAFGFGTGILVAFAYGGVTAPVPANAQPSLTAVPLQATKSIESVAPSAE